MPAGHTVSVSGNSIASEVEKFIGSPYVYGGTSPKGFDCSGLVQYVLAQVGVTAPRTSEEQWGWVQKINKSQLAPGDLVFAQFPGDNASPGHVGIYTGNGKVLSAEDPALGVGYATLDSWAGNIVGYGRVPGGSAGTASAGTSSASGTTASAPPASYSDLGVGGILSGASGLLKDVATVLDYVFGMFGRGQGWRLVFTLIAGIALIASYKSLASAGVVPDVHAPAVVPV